MTDPTRVQVEVAQKAVAAVPVVDGGVTAVTVGSFDAPDVVLSCMQCEAAMGLVRRWQERRGGPLDVEISSVMGVCGDVAVKAHLTGRVCLSFGCPDSREYGRIGRDRLIAGVPASLADELL